MYKNLDRLYVALSLSVIALIGGCASSPPSAVSSMAAADASAPGSKKAVTTFDEQSVAALSDDEFWTKGTEATVDENGRLVYRVSPAITDDGNYNRIELEAQRPAPTGLRYDPITGYPIFRQPISRPRGTQPTVQPAPRVQAPVVSQPRSGNSDSGRRRRDSRR